MNADTLSELRCINHLGYECRKLLEDPTPIGNVDKFTNPMSCIKPTPRPDSYWREGNLSKYLDIKQVYEIYCLMLVPLV